MTGGAEEHGTSEFHLMVLPPLCRQGALRIWFKEKGMIGIRRGVLAATMVFTAGCDSVSGYLDMRSQLKEMETSLSALQQEHADLVARYQTLQLENEELKTILAKRGNIRNLYAR